MSPTRAYSLFQFLGGFGMCMITLSYVPFLLGIGLTWAEISLVNAVFFATIVIAEVPTGLLADGHSRIWSLRVGAAVHAVATLGYFTANDFVSAAFWELLCGIGAAFVSGADQAWLTDALIRHGERERLGKALASAALYQSLGMLLGGVASAALAAVNLRLGWLAATAVLAVQFLVAYRFMNGDGEPAVRLTEGDAFRASLSALRASRGLKWAVAAAMAMGLVLPFNYGWVPFFQGRAGHAAMPLIWVALYSSLTATGWLLRRVDLKQGVESWSIPLALASAGFGLAGIGLVGGWAWPLAAGVIHEIGRGAQFPLVSLFIQRRVESGYRATYGSLQSLLGRFGYAAILLVTWLITRGSPSTEATIVSAWAWSGLALAACALFLWFTRPRQ